MFVGQSEEPGKKQASKNITDKLPTFINIQNSRYHDNVRDRVISSENEPVIPSTAAGYAGPLEVSKQNKPPGPIRVESFEGHQSLAEFQNQQELCITAGVARDHPEEELKAARFTNFSKNTCNSANSLEYSPSPKRDSYKVTPGEQASPIPDVPNEARREGLPVPLETVPVSEPAMALSSNISQIMVQTSGYDYSPQVLVCGDVTAMNLSFQDINFRNFDRTYDNQQDLKNVDL